MCIEMIVFLGFYNFDDYFELKVLVINDFFNWRFL